MPTTRQRLVASVVATLGLTTFLVVSHHSSPQRASLAADISAPRTFSNHASRSYLRLPDGGREEPTTTTVPPTTVPTTLPKKQPSTTVSTKGPTSGQVYGTGPGGAKTFIYNHESGNNPARISRYNGACGLGQAYPCSKLTCPLTEAGYACQDAWFEDYMRRKYGTWENAQWAWIRSAYRCKNNTDWCGGSW